MCMVMVCVCVCVFERECVCVRVYAYADIDWAVFQAYPLYPFPFKFGPDTKEHKGQESEGRGR